MAQKEADAVSKLEAYIAEQEELLRINPKDLNEDFVLQPAFYQAAGIKHAKAQRILEQMKHGYDQAVASKDAEIRSSEQKTTEKFIEQQVKLDPGVGRAKSRVIDATYQAACYQVNMRAWEHKKDMLIQIGSTQRAEFQANVSINRDGGDDMRPRRGSDKNHDPFGTDF